MPQTPHYSDNALNYLLYLPESYSERSSWPLIVFLHGRGESGNDLTLVKKYGLPYWIDREKNFPFIVLSPQCPNETRWTDHTQDVLSLITMIQQRYTVNKIYLNGFSMGGQGAWQLAAAYPHLFSALVVICGRTPPQENFLAQMIRLKNLPTWVFHGANDQQVPLEHSQKMVAALQAAGGNVTFTIFPDADHFCWDRVYLNPDFYAFFGSDWQSFS